MIKIPFTVAFLFLFNLSLLAQTCAENAVTTAPVLSENARKTYETKLTEARADFDKNPLSADAMIWLGRRTAYLGNYKEAIKIFTGGIEKYPRDARFLRHRGHRFITIRCFDDAVQDFETAAKLVRGKPDEIEPDGLPNARGIPTSTLKTNIFYHLGLAYYLKGDFKDALEAYKKCAELSKNPDMLVAAKHWLYMTLRRLGEEKKAAKAVAGVKDGLDIIENDDYYKLVRLYQGKLKAEDLLKELGAQTDTLSNASLGYGLGNWFLSNGEYEKAQKIFRQITRGDQWASFGFIAAESELFQENAADENSSCVKLELVEQKKLPPAKTKPAPDVIVYHPDDIESRFKLTNQCRKPVFYLISTVSKSPVGFMLYRSKSGDWKARSPGWGSEGIFSGLGYEWIELSPANNIEIVFTDISRIEGTRSATIYINRSPAQIGRTEIRAAPYLPIRIDSQTGN